MEKKPLTVKEFASMGGKACAKNRTKAERSAAARKAAQARWKKARAVAVILALLSLAAPLSAQEKDSPFKDSLKWGGAMAATSYADLATTMSWSSRPSSCMEGNGLLANADGTANGPKSVMMKGAFIGGLTAALYIGKKLHWKPVEMTAKAVISANSGMYAYYSIKSLSVCR